MVTVDFIITKIELYFLNNCPIRGIRTNPGSMLDDNLM